LGRNAKPGQLGSILFPGLKRFVGKEDNFPPIFPEPPDHSLCPGDELIASIDRPVQVEDKSFKHLSPPLRYPLRT
jgi:hypothetical protein